MERSRKLLGKIASASQQVITAANNYADCEDLDGVSRYHFQLEEDMRRISVACECLAGHLDSPTHQGPLIDDRIRDWVVTDEPRECIHALNHMESLLQGRTSSRTLQIFRGGRTLVGPPRDKIKEAVDFFNKRRGCFHFLFSIEIWNNERDAERQSNILHSETDVTKEDPNKSKSLAPVQGKNKPTLQTNLDGRQIRSIQEEHISPRALVQDEPPPSYVENETSPLEAVGRKEGYVVTKNMKTSKQKEDEEKKLEEVLKWLDGLSCAEKQDATLLLRQEDTCKWLFDTTQYQNWKDGESASLWLRGKAGAGKSVLASFVIDSFRKAQLDDDLLIFFYCDFRTERSTNSAEAMRSILSQLLAQLRGLPIDFGNMFNDLMKAKAWGGRTLSNPKELAEYAARAAKQLSRKPVVVVDALDECKDVRTLIQALMVLRGHVQLFITSRPLHIIMDDLLDVPFVSTEDMADRLLADIELHVSRELDGRQRLRDLDSELKTEIRSTLCEGADGMFRWVQCSIDTLNQCMTRKEVRYALKRLPKGLDETYERILLAIDMDSQVGELAQRALVWLVAGLRPLRLSEIMEALSIDLTTRALNSDIGPMHKGALLEACGSLVTHNEDTGIIILAHSSVKDYLTGEFTRAKLSRYHISLQDAHLLLMQSCMCYISICLRTRGGGLSTQSRVAPTQSQPLLDYALDDSLEHFGFLGPNFMTALHAAVTLAGDIDRYAWMWDHVFIPARWEVGDNRSHWPAARHDLAFYILITFVPSSSIGKFLRQTALKPKEGTNPLVYAAYFNKVEYIDPLLSQGVKPNERGWEIVGYRQSLPIEVAFRNWNYGMVARFVEAESTVPSHIFTESFFERGWSKDTPYSLQTIPSFVARVLVQTNEFAESIRDCLSEAAFRAIQASNQLLVFRDATEQDLDAIIRRFIQVSCDHRTSSVMKEAFFRFAIAQGYLSVARHLLSIMDTPLPPDLLVGLHYFPGKWKTAPIIQFLVDNGANVLVCTEHGDSLLHAVLWAAGGNLSYMVDRGSEDGILDAVELLIGLGCDPLAVDSSGNTPLQIAIEAGCVSVAQYLLTRGTPPPLNLPVTLNHDRSLWSKASMISLLFENGVDASTRVGDGGSLLHVAVQCWNNEGEVMEAVELLIGRGCNPLEANASGHTPFHIAVEQGYINLARYLLTFNPPDGTLTMFIDGSSPRWRIANLIRFLVGYGVTYPQIAYYASSGDSLLHAALQFLEDNGEALEAVKTLIGRGCDPLEPNCQGKTPLHLAVERNLISLAQYLLSLGAPVPHDTLATLGPNSGQLALTAPTVRFLVENGANPLSRAPNGDTLIHVLAGANINDLEALEAMKFLVGCGCDPLEANLHGDTPFNIAINRGHVSVARYLLTFRASVPSDVLVTFKLNRDRWGAYQSTTSMVRFLCETGADVLARTEDGDCVLHIVLRSFAYENDMLEATKFLVGCGCNPIQTNYRGHTPLHIAVQYGHISAAQYLLTLGPSIPLDLSKLNRDWLSFWSTGPMIRLLVENGLDVRARTSDGGSLLHLALRCSNVEDEILMATKVLVGCGCNPLVANHRGKTPLHTAIEQGHLSTARYLLSQGASIAPDLLVDQLYQIQWSSAPMIRFLVENGVDVYARAGDGRSAIHFMLRCWSLDDNLLAAMKVLVGYGCDPLEADFEGRTPLHIAIEEGLVSTARHLLSLGASVPPDLLIKLTPGRSLLWSMAPMIHFLFENGVNFLAQTNDGDSVLHLALQCSNNDDELLAAVKALVGYGCNPLAANLRGKTPVYTAIEQGHLPATRYLLSLGASIPPNILITGQLDRRQSRWGTAPMIYFLLDNEVDIFAHAGDGSSAIHFALQCWNSDDDVLATIKVLVERGCNPLEADIRGSTPFHIAVNNGYTSVARYLLTLGATCPPDLLLTLNHDEPLWSIPSMVHFLIESGVNVLALATDGDCVLHAASRCFNYDSDALEVIETLINRGCDPLKVNSIGAIPLHFAAEQANIFIAQYLIAQGEDVLTKTSSGDTALHFATGARGYSSRARYDIQDIDSEVFQTVKYFVGCGCDPAAANNNGRTPLHNVVDLGRIRTIKYLLSLNVPLPSDILFIAIQSNDSAVYCHHIAQALVTSGCNPGAPNAEGVTPLRAAIMKGRVKVVEYLLSVLSADDLLFEELLSAVDVAPPSVQGEMKRLLSGLRPTPDSPKPPSPRIMTPDQDLVSAVYAASPPVLDNPEAPSPRIMTPDQDLVSAVDVAPPPVPDNLEAPSSRIVIPGQWDWTL